MGGLDILLFVNPFSIFAERTLFTVMIINAPPREIAHPACCLFVCLFFTGENFIENVRENFSRLLLSIPRGFIAPPLNDEEKLCILLDWSVIVL